MILPILVYLLCPLVPPSHCLILTDSGSSGNYATFDLSVVNQQPTSCPITIQLPNGEHVVSTHEAELDIPILLLAARTPCAPCPWIA
jgi:hypothetical protein